MQLAIQLLIRIVKLGFFLFLIVIGLIIIVNLYVMVSSQNQTYSIEKLKQERKTIDEATPILVLGAGIIDSETPSKILEQRLLKTVEVAEVLAQNPIIMSGDHMDEYYDEVTVMKKYVVAKGIESQRVYLDHAGYSTFESLYRLKEVLKQDKVIIITQGYHLSRALMLARGLGLEAIGIPAEEYPSTRLEREFREVFARLKDFAITYLNYPHKTPELGYGFDLSKSGDLTNEKMDLSE